MLSVFHCFTAPHRLLYDLVWLHKSHQMSSEPLWNGRILITLLFYALMRLFLLYHRFPLRICKYNFKERLFNQNLKLMAYLGTLSKRLFFVCYHLLYYKSLDRLDHLFLNLLPTSN